MTGVRLMFRKGPSDMTWKAPVTDTVEAWVALRQSGQFRAVFVIRDGKIRIREVGMYPTRKDAQGALGEHAERIMQHPWRPW